MAALWHTRQHKTIKYEFAHKTNPIFLQNLLWFILYLKSLAHVILRLFLPGVRLKNEFD
jgi:hypothetical protein